MYTLAIQTIMLIIGITLIILAHIEADPIALILANIWIVGSILYGKPKE